MYELLDSLRLKTVWELGWVCDKETKNRIMRNYRITISGAGIWVWESVCDRSTWDYTHTRLGQYQTLSEAKESILNHKWVRSESIDLVDFATKNCININFVQPHPKYKHYYYYFVVGGMFITAQTGEEQSYIISHELGHAIAYRLGLDENDEALAWAIAEKLWIELKGQPPTEWYMWRKVGLDSHRVSDELKPFEDENWKEHFQW